MGKQVLNYKIIKPNFFNWKTGMTKSRFGGKFWVEQSQRPRVYKKTDNRIFGYCKNRLSIWVKMNLLLATDIDYLFRKSTVNILGSIAQTTQYYFFKQLII